MKTDVSLACQDPELLNVFDRAIGQDDQAVEAAVAACSGCPITEACYMQGVETKSAGVWGGVLLPITPRYRQADTCKRGHDLSGSNARRRTDGTRVCRTCETTARHSREGRA